MPATLHSLRSKLVELDIKIDDDPHFLTIKYRPHALTAANEKLASDKTQRGQELGGLIELFLPVVAEWNLKEYEDGPVIELTRDELTEKVPADILMDIMNQISEDRKPDPKETN